MVVGFKVDEGLKEREGGRERETAERHG